MKVISAVFETQAQGEQAAAALENAGVGSSSISIAPADTNADGGPGDTLVTATVDEDQSDIAEAILGPTDVASRPAERERDAWNTNDPDAVLPGDRISDDRPDLPPLPR